MITDPRREAVERMVTEFVGQTRSRALIKQFARRHLDETLTDAILAWHDAETRALREALATALLARLAPP